ncbi:uncharacterized protein LOC130212072 isoform X1 [Pseudoliparis swirei]|uniref:uncharacterized protein LOC130212072 isoform X1 n=1 Tax=Pseudoliparis swirei TaxID=2059687 RepID=UPI0024BE217B|nr:uncharacterized protein LOC130212072 isoform X1 [Pseudoliparis swirei]
MDHPTSCQHSQHSHTSSFQWLSFAHQSLTEIPYEAILPQTDSLQVLDLSNNLLDEYPLPNNQTTAPGFRSLLEPGSAGPAAEAQHSDPGLQQLHVSHQVPLHDHRDHAVHQQEQDQQPAAVCGRNTTQVPQLKDPQYDEQRGSTELFQWRKSDPVRRLQTVRHESDPMPGDPG